MAPLPRSRPPDGLSPEEARRAPRATAPPADKPAGAWAAAARGRAAAAAGARMAFVYVADGPRIVGCTAVAVGGTGISDGIHTVVEPVDAAARLPEGARWSSRPVMREEGGRHERTRSRLRPGSAAALPAPGRGRAVMRNGTHRDPRT